MYHPLLGDYAGKRP
jgi:hypothetical protein